MSLTFLSSALLVISIVTNLTVESVKKIFISLHVNYSANALAAIMSVAIAVISSVLYLNYFEIAFCGKVIVEIVVLSYLSFLVSTVGYDKVIQMIDQIKTVK